MRVLRHRAEPPSWWDRESRTIRTSEMLSGRRADAAATTGEKSVAVAACSLQSRPPLLLVMSEDIHRLVIRLRGERLVLGGAPNTIGGQRPRSRSRQLVNNRCRVRSRRRGDRSPRRVRPGPRSSRPGGRRRFRLRRRPRSTALSLRERRVVAGLAVRARCRI